MINTLCLAICDDEEKYRNTEIELCNQYFKEKNISVEIISFTSGEELLAYIGQIDIILLDIQMQGINGIEVKENLLKQKKNSSIIYVTNHEHLMRPAFGKNVYGFISKPIRQEELIKILHVICKERLDNRYIQVTDEIRIKLNELKYIKSEDKYCIFYVEDIKQLVRTKISDWENKLPDDFIRINKSYIVNFEFIQYKNNKIILEDNTFLNIAREKKELFRINYNKYTMENAW